MKALLEKGVSPNTIDQIGGETPLMYAMGQNHFECAKLLLKFGADVNVRAKDGHTVMDVIKGKPEMFKLIELERNTDTSLVSNFQEALSLMPELLMDMTKALKDEKAKLIREFYVLPNRHVILGRSSKPRLVYYEDDYENLQNKLDILEDYGFITDVRVGDTPIYRMTPELVRFLLTD